jgi:outer membrane protein TolC
MPWTLGKAAGRVEEAEAAMQRSSETYTSDKNMVLADVRRLYYEADAARSRLGIYRDVLLAKARMSMLSGLTAYQTGTADFLSVNDAYRTLVDVRSEYYAVRLEYEQTLAALERAVGTQNILVAK